jgi:hypothetical protein
LEVAWKLSLYFPLARPQEESGLEVCGGFLLQQSFQIWVQLPIRSSHTEQASTA